MVKWIAQFKTLYSIIFVCTVISVLGTIYVNRNWLTAVPLWMSLAFVFLFWSLILLICIAVKVSIRKNK